MAKPEVRTIKRHIREAYGKLRAIVDNLDKINDSNYSLSYNASVKVICSCGRRLEDFEDGYHGSDWYCCPCGKDYNLFESNGKHKQKSRK